MSTNWCIEYWGNVTCHMPHIGILCGRNNATCCEPQYCCCNFVFQLFIPCCSWTLLWERLLLWHRTNLLLLLLNLSLRTLSLPRRWSEKFQFDFTYLFIDVRTVFTLSIYENTDKRVFEMLGVCVYVNYVNINAIIFGFLCKNLNFATFNVTGAARFS